MTTDPRCTHVDPTRGRCLALAGHYPTVDGPNGTTLDAHTYPGDTGQWTAAADEVEARDRANLLELLEGAMTYAVGCFVEVSMGIREPTDDDARAWALELLDSWQGRRELGTLANGQGTDDVLLEAGVDAVAYGAGYLRLDRRGVLTRIDPTRIRLTGPRGA